MTTELLVEGIQWLQDNGFALSARHSEDQAREIAYSDAYGHGHTTLLFDPGYKGWEASVWQGTTPARVGVPLGVCWTVKQMGQLWAVLKCLDYDEYHKQETRAALEELIINANRLCDRMLGGTYEEDCRRSLERARKALR